MLLPRSLVVLVLSAVTLAAQRPVRRDHANLDYYVLEHDSSSSVSIQELSSALGLEVVEPVGELVGHWLLSISRPALGRRDGSDPVLDTLHRLRAVARSHSAGSHLPRSLHETHRAKRLVSAVRSIERQVLKQRAKRVSPDARSDQTPHATKVDVQAVAARFGIHDPLFSQQWHLINDANAEHMMNVTPAWAEGVTGKGVTVAMVDDGVDYESEDLAANFDAAGSHDFNDHVALPKPMLSDDTHGTRCAGEIAAGKNNVCGVGIAYEAKIAGLRILSGPVTDADEAAALNYNFQNTSIYSCSWGPPDDGKTMDRPSTLNTKAVVNGVQNGRGGKGSIFVFASGNGASSGDQCNFDGYTNSIFTVTVGAIDFTGKHPYYSEACAAMMVVTYSSGGGRHITSTNVGKRECSSNHGGTSAAAPLASAVFALALQVRPDLTWRDIQHLCVNAAVQVNRKDPDWEMTAAKRPYSYKYGYGKLDAALFVAAARKWKLVKPQAFIESHVMELGNADMGKDGKMTGGEFIKPGGITHNFEVTTTMLTSGNFESLEHITVKVWITHPRRGDVQVELISPNGIKSVLAGVRKYDEDPHGFTGWEFSTLKHWDENPIGIWTIRVADQSQPDKKGYFLGWQMSLWGATIDPAKYKPWVVPSLSNDAEEEATPSSTSTPTASPANANGTKQHPKPTDHLPGDHGSAEGEAHEQAFPQQTTSGTAVATSSPPVVPPVKPSTSDTKADSSSPTSSPTPSSIVPQVVQDHQWVFSGLAAFAVIGFGTAIFIWHRRVRQRRAAMAEYDRVAEDEDIAMRSRGRDSVVRDREDEFDEDNDELDAEGARLTGHGVGFHDGFLEDDDPASARSPNRPYRDNPPSYDNTPRRSLDVQHA